MEIYGSNRGSRQASSRQIREMKKNMQKVPHIQKKSDEYHHQEEIRAEKILTQVDEIHKDDEKILQIQESDIQSPVMRRWKSIIQKIRFIFTK